MNTVIIDEITKKLRNLPDNLQRQVLIFVDALQSSSVRGTQGKVLVEFAGTISLNDLSLMKESIEAGCEQINTRA
jgi:hypothetical protein